tara:strand:- start:831 stop:1277 length:447 start_codon:yes stop_codon:yes gene_type:complete
MDENIKRVVVNKGQGNFWKVLCVCTSGVLRSPTAAWVLSTEPFNFNTRSCGTEKGYALIHVSDVLVAWADEIVVMDSGHASDVQRIADCIDAEVAITNLDIPDDFNFREEQLVNAIIIHYAERSRFATDEMKREAAFLRHELGIPILM